MGCMSSSFTAAFKKTLFQTTTSAFLKICFQQLQSVKKIIVLRASRQLETQHLTVWLPNHQGHNMYLLRHHFLLVLYSVCRFREPADSTLCAHKHEWMLNRRQDWPVLLLHCSYAFDHLIKLSGNSNIGDDVTHEDLLNWWLPIQLHSGLNEVCNFTAECRSPIFLYMLFCFTSFALRVCFNQVFGQP